MSKILERGVRRPSKSLDATESRARLRAESGMDDGELLRRVLAGDELAKTRFVRRLEPIVRGVVRYRLRAWPGRRIGERGQDDIVNDVWRQLFDDDCARIRGWDAERSSLESLIKNFAVWRVSEYERKELRRLGLFGRPVSEDEAPEPEGATRPDEILEARELARRILACVEEAFTTDLARRMVRLILREQRTTDAVVETTQMSRQQIFRWRHRLLARARECWERIRDANA
ncbi:MAG: hypothetical protein RMA76_09335 [Deltaproteobacteria bacterium]|jgi:hypothetical protein